MAAAHMTLTHTVHTHVHPSTHAPTVTCAHIAPMRTHECAHTHHYTYVRTHAPPHKRTCAPTRPLAPNACTHACTAHTACQGRRTMRDADAVASADLFSLHEALHPELAEPRIPPRHAIGGSDELLRGRQLLVDDTLIASSENLERAKPPSARAGRVHAHVRTRTRTTRTGGHNVLMCHGRRVPSRTSAGDGRVGAAAELLHGVCARHARTHARARACTFAWP